MSREGCTNIPMTRNRHADSNIHVSIHERATQVTDEGRTMQSMRSVAPRRMRRWSTWLLVVVLAVLALALHAANAQEQSATGDVAPALQELQTKEIPEFVPSKQWQDVLPGQAIPPGLHVRLNLATGKREAKIISEDDVDAVAIASPEQAGVEHEPKAEEESVTVATDITGEIKEATVASPSGVESHALTIVESEDEAASEDEALAIQEEVPTSDVKEPLDEAPPAKQEPNWNHEKIYEVLQALPTPPQVDGMDIYEARARLAEPEFRRHMIKLWKKRQEELKEAIDTMQDDAKYIAKLLDQLREAEKNGDTKGQLSVLEVLEWEVQDLDKTHVFNFIGGFSVIAEYLNSTNLPVRASASWLVGTAVKNYKDGQDWAINAGVIPKLVDSLALPLTAVDADRAAQIHEVKKKALYALSSLVRFNPRGQRLLLSLQGPDKVSQLLDGKHPLGVQLKSVLFVHDLFQEGVPVTPLDDDAAALQQLHEAFRSSEWCLHTATFIADYAPKLERHQVVEIIQAMQAQLPACKNDFASVNAKATIQSIQSRWQEDSSLEEDDREDLVAVSSSLLSEL